MTLKKQNGASAVEFAVILPFLVMLVFGIIEFGLMLYNKQVLTNASREGARAAIVGNCAAGTEMPRKTDAEIGQIVIDYCIDPDDTTKKRLISFTPWTPDDILTTINPSPSDCTVGFGDDVTVTVDWNYTFLLPYLLGYFNPTKQLRANTVMKMESDP